MTAAKSKQKFVSYTRVSTAKQGESGLGLDAQRDAIKQHVGTGELLREFKEVESGKRSDRPELLKALAFCRQKKATLVIAKLDRLSRNVHFLSGLMEAKVPFIACDNPSATPLTLHILAAVAENEAKAISARTRAALAESKKKLGGRRMSATAWKRIAADARTERSERVAAHRAELREYIAKHCSGTLQQIADGLNERSLLNSKLSPPRGGEWSPTQVWRVMKAAS
jgi:DNA invertase Pin-like site-specific DNA recombinase